MGTALAYHVGDQGSTLNMLIHIWDFYDKILEKCKYLLENDNE